MKVWTLRMTLGMTPKSRGCPAHPACMNVNRSSSSSIGLIASLQNKVVAGSLDICVSSSSCVQREARRVSTFCTHCGCRGVGELHCKPLILNVVRECRHLFFHFLLRATVELAYARTYFSYGLSCRGAVFLFIRAGGRNGIGRLQTLSRHCCSATRRLTQCEFSGSRSGSDQYVEPRHSARPAQLLAPRFRRLRSSRYTHRPERCDRCAVDDDSCCNRTIVFRAPSQGGRGAWPYIFSR